jgi:hypothetical protein
MNPKIVYLDQNKWIALAKAAKNPEEESEARSALEFLINERRAGRVLLPLTATNVYETHKINNPERRFDLAYCMTTLGEAYVFRGRHRRLEVEVVDAVRRAYGLSLFEREQHWFLSRVFYESTAEWNDPRLGQVISQTMYDFARSNPQEFLFGFLMDTSDDVRTTAVRQFSQGVDGVRQQIEERRARNAGETESMPPPVGWPTRAEMEAMLSVPDRKTRRGRSEYALLLFLYNTEARASEATQLIVHVEKFFVRNLGGLIHAPDSCAGPAREGDKPHAEHVRG